MTINGKEVPNIWWEPSWEDCDNILPEDQWIDEDEELPFD